MGNSGGGKIKALTLYAIRMFPGFLKGSRKLSKGHFPKATRYVPGGLKTGLFKFIRFPWSNRIAGIDITPGCIYLCEVEKGNSLSCLAAECIKGNFLSHDIYYNRQQYVEGLKRLLDSNGIKTRKVALSLPVKGSMMKIATTAIMGDREIVRAIKYGPLWKGVIPQGEKPELYSIFYQPVRKNPEAGTMDIMLVAAKIEEIKLYSDIVRQSGLKPVIVDIKCLAIYHAITNAHREKPVIFIEAGSECSYIMLVEGGAPKIYNVPFEEKAQTAMAAIFAKQARAIAPPGCRDIIISCPSPILPGFMEGLADAMPGYEISQCDLFDLLDIDDDFTIDKKSAAHRICSWAGAIAMALLPLRPVREDKYPKKEGRYEFFPLLNPMANIGAIILMALGLGGMLKYHTDLMYRKMELDSQVATMAPVAVEYEIKKSTVEDAQRLVSGLLEVERIAIALQDEDNQRYVISVYNHLNNIIQDGVWLSSLSFETPDRVQVTGRSYEDGNIISFLNNLEGSRVFATMSLQHMQEIKEMQWYSSRWENIKTFSFDGRIVNDLPGLYLEKPSLIAGEEQHGG